MTLIEATKLKKEQKAFSAFWRRNTRNLSIFKKSTRKKREISPKDWKGGLLNIFVVGLRPPSHGAIGHWLKILKRGFPQSDRTRRCRRSTKFIQRKRKRSVVDNGLGFFWVIIPNSCAASIGPIGGGSDGL